MPKFSLSKINDQIAKESIFVESLKKSISEVIVGQNELIDKIADHDGSAMDQGIINKYLAI